MVFLICRGQDLRLVDHVDAERLENLGLDKVSDPGLAHHGNGDGIDNLSNL